ncbi:TPA: helix-turn-helix domain-containing protein [Streptococcus suis]
MNAGLDPAMLYRLRDGKVKDLHFETVKKIAKALDVSLDELAKI